MLTNAEYQAALANGQARPARATCPMCHGTGFVADPDHLWSPLPCHCGCNADEARRRMAEREAYRRAWAR